MPYSVDRKNKCIYKKKSDGTRGEKVGCTKGNIDDYLAALHIHADEGKTMKKEEIPGAISTLYMVQKPFSGCEPGSLVKQIDPMHGITSDHGIEHDQVHALYSDEDLANDTANELYEEHKKKELALEEKKGTVVDKIKKAIDVLEKKRKEHTEKAKEDPKNASSSREEIAKIVNKVDDLMTKLEKIEKSKKPVEKDTNKK